MDDIVILKGVLRKAKCHLKNSKRRFFLLRKSCRTEAVYLDYFDGDSCTTKAGKRKNPKRSIPIKECFNINGIIGDAKTIQGVAVFTFEDCIMLGCTDEAEAQKWLDSLRLAHEAERPKFWPLVDSSFRETKSYDFCWEVLIQSKELGSKFPDMADRCRLCLDISKPTEAVLLLWRVRRSQIVSIPTDDAAGATTSQYQAAASSCSWESTEDGTKSGLHCWVFPLDYVKSWSSKGRSFLLTVGRQSPTGSGKLIMDTEVESIAKNIHLTLASTIEQLSKAKQAQPSESSIDNKVISGGGSKMLRQPSVVKPIQKSIDLASEPSSSSLCHGLADRSGSVSTQDSVRMSFASISMSQSGDVASASVPNVSNPGPTPSSYADVSFNLNTTSIEAKTTDGPSWSLKTDTMMAPIPDVIPTGHPPSLGPASNAPCSVRRTSTHDSLSQRVPEPGSDTTSQGRNSVDNEAFDVPTSYGASAASTAAGQLQKSPSQSLKPSSSSTSTPQASNFVAEDYLQMTGTSQGFVVPSASSLKDAAGASVIDGSSTVVGSPVSVHHTPPATIKGQKADAVSSPYLSMGPSPEPVQTRHIRQYSEQLEEVQSFVLTPESSSNDGSLASSYTGGRGFHHQLTSPSQHSLLTGGLGPSGPALHSGSGQDVGNLWHSARCYSLGSRPTPSPKPPQSKLLYGVGGGQSVNQQRIIGHQMSERGHPKSSIISARHPVASHHYNKNPSTPSAHHAIRYTPMGGATNLPRRHTRATISCTYSRPLKTSLAGNELETVSDAAHDTSRTQRSNTDSMTETAAAAAIAAAKSSVGMLSGGSVGTRKSFSSTSSGICVSSDDFTDYVRRYDAGGGPHANRGEIPKQPITPSLVVSGEPRTRTQEWDSHSVDGPAILTTSVSSIPATLSITSSPAASISLANSNYLNDIVSLSNTLPTSVQGPATYADAAIFTDPTDTRKRAYSFGNWTKPLRSKLKSLLPSADAHFLLMSPSCSDPSIRNRADSFESKTGGGVGPSSSRAFQIRNMTSRLFQSSAPVQHGVGDTTTTTDPLTGRMIARRKTSHPDYVQMRYAQEQPTPHEFMAADHLHHHHHHHLFSTELAMSPLNEMSSTQCLDDELASVDYNFPTNTIGGIIDQQHPLATKPSFPTSRVSSSGPFSASNNFLNYGTSVGSGSDDLAEFDFNTKGLVLPPPSVLPTAHSVSGATPPLHSILAQPRNPFNLHHHVLREASPSQHHQHMHLLPSSVAGGPTAPLSANSFHIDSSIAEPGSATHSLLIALQQHQAGIGGGAGGSGSSRVSPASSATSFGGSSESLGAAFPTASRLRAGSLGSSMLNRFWSPRIELIREHTSESGGGGGSWGGGGIHGNSPLAANQQGSVDGRNEKEFSPKRQLSEYEVMQPLSNFSSDHNANRLNNSDSGSSVALPPGGQTTTSGTKSGHDQAAPARCVTGGRLTTIPAGRTSEYILMDQQPRQERKNPEENVSTDAQSESAQQQPDQPSSEYLRMDLSAGAKCTR